MIDSEIYFKIAQVAVHVGRTRQLVEMHARNGWLKTVKMPGVRGQRLKLANANKWIALHHPNVPPITGRHRTTSPDEPVSYHLASYTAADRSVAECVLGMLDRFANGSNPATVAAAQRFLADIAGPLNSAYRERRVNHLQTR